MELISISAQITKQQDYDDANSNMPELKQSRPQKCHDRNKLLQDLNRGAQRIFPFIYTHFIYNNGTSVIATFI
jgi:hypothetical protein